MTPRGQCCCITYFAVLSHRRKQSFNASRACVIKTCLGTSDSWCRMFLLSSIWTNQTCLLSCIYSHSDLLLLLWLPWLDAGIISLRASSKCTTVLKMQLIFTHVSYALQTSNQCTRSAALHSKLYQPVLLMRWWVSVLETLISILGSLHLSL